MGDAPGLRIGRLVLQPWLDHFEVPVAELIPGEVTQRPGRLVELVTIEVRGDLGSGACQPTENPAILDRQAVTVTDRRQAAGLVALEIEHREAGSVPELVAEVSSGLEPLGHHPRHRLPFVGVVPRTGVLPRFPTPSAVDPRLLTAAGHCLLVFQFLWGHVTTLRTLVTDREPDILRLTGERGNGEPYGIGTVAIDQVHRIDAVAFRFRHCLAETVEDLRMDTNVRERDVAHVVEPRQHHPGHPQGDDVAAGDQHAAGIEVVKTLGGLGPSQRRMGPQRRAEPGIKYVLVLNQLVVRAQLVPGQVSLAADQPPPVLLVFAPTDIIPFAKSRFQVLAFTRAAVPDRDLVPPPQLA